MKRYRFELLTLLVALGCGVLGPLLHSAGTFERLEKRAFDRLLVDRYLSYGTRPVDDRILIVEIDDAFHRGLSKPSVFWYEEYAELTEGLLRSEALVGIDILLEERVGGLRDRESVSGFLAEFDRMRESLLANILGGRVVVATDVARFRGWSGLHRHRGSCLLLSHWRDSFRAPTQSLRRQRSDRRRWYCSGSTGRLLGR